MATFSKIDGAEPSTVTFSLKTVTQDMGGATQHMEAVVLGGPDSSLAIAVVTNAAPASTAFALAVREVSPTTSVRVFQSTAADLNVTVAGYVAPSTTVQVSSLGGAVITRSSAANSLHTVYQSTAADLNVTVAGYVAPSTTVSVSTGSVRVHQSSAADLNVTVGGVASVSVVDTVNIADGGASITVDDGNGSLTVDGIVAVTQATYTDLNGLMRVADRDNSTAVAAVVNATQPASTAYGLVVRMPAPVTDSTNNALRVNVVAGAAGGSTQVTVSQLLDSSGGSVATGDSANNAIRVNVVAGAAGGSTYVSVRQSTAADLNAAVIQGSTNWSVQVSTGAISVSTGSITVHQGSTNFSVQVSTGAVSVSTGSVTVHQGSTLFSVQSRNTTSSGGGIEGSTTTPAQGVLGMHVRPVYPTMNSTTIVVTSTNSTAIYPLISSVAGLRHKVYAYFVGSTHTNPSTLIFCSSASASGFDHWHVHFGSGSSGMTGANLALNPPGYIFAGVSQNALNVKIEGGSSATSTCIARISVAWFDEA